MKINVPENFNFGYDVVDAWAAEQPDKPALLWTNDQGECRQFTFADMKRYTDMTASYFQSLGIGHGDMVMLILKRRYEFWFSIVALHKLGAVVIPATHLLTKKDIVYRCNAADIKLSICGILSWILFALPLFKIDSLTIYGWNLFSTITIEDKSFSFSGIKDPPTIAFIIYERA